MGARWSQRRRRRSLERELSELGTSAALLGRPALTFPSQPERRLLLASYERLKTRHNGNLGDQLFQNLLRERPHLALAFSNNIHAIRRHSFMAQETLDMMLELVSTSPSADDLAYHVMKFGSFHAFYARRQPVARGDWEGLERALSELVLDALPKRRLEERRLRRLWVPLLHFIVACLEMGHRRGWECQGRSSCTPSQGRAMGGSVAGPSQPSAPRPSLLLAKVSIGNAAAGLSQVFSHSGIGLATLARVNSRRFKRKNSRRRSSQLLPTLSSDDELGLDNEELALSQAPSPRL